VVVDPVHQAVVRVHSHSGDRTIVSGCSDRDLSMGRCNARIGSGPPLLTPLAITVETHGSLVVADAALAAVVRVHPRRGDRTLVSR